MLIRPTSLFIGCATSADNVGAITWSTWTSTGATGTATHNVNDCQPNCAEGTYSHVAVNVRLSNPGNLDGLYVFRTISMTPTSGAGGPQAFTANGLYGQWGWVPS